MARIYPSFTVVEQVFAHPEWDSGADTHTEVAYFEFIEEAELYAKQLGSQSGDYSHRGWRHYVRKNKEKHE